MAAFESGAIRGIVFDLDGTLYISAGFAAEIQNASETYIAGVKQISQAEAGLLMTATRVRLENESGTVQTLSAVCTELGGTIRNLHHFFESTLRPEAYLVRDERVVQLIKKLGARYALYLYTNNNRVLTARIINYLGLEGLLSDIFTIDDEWRGKPDEEMVTKVLEKTGLSACEALFVGDRYDVDLRLPEVLGCPVYLSQNLEQLLRLEELLISFSGSVSAPADPPVVQS